MHASTPDALPNTAFSLLLTPITDKKRLFTMVHAPEVTEYIKQAATKMDAVSDDIDEVNVMKGKKPTFDDQSEFDAAKDKQGFRQYEAACDRVKNFYAVSQVNGFCGEMPG
jgi:hypothetical protein